MTALGIVLAAILHAASLWWPALVLAAVALVVLATGAHR